MIHYFTEDIVFAGPEYFTDPFRYIPHPLVRKASEEVIEMIDSDKTLSNAFSEGKMLGVLICRKGETTCYITAFSGTINGMGCIEGFVPPIYDLTVPGGHFRNEEAIISSLNRKIRDLSKSDTLSDIRKKLADCQTDRDMDLNRYRKQMLKDKTEREHIRSGTSDVNILADLTKKSQFAKAEFKRLKASWAAKEAELKAELDLLESEIEELKRLRAQKSDMLQEWIFNQYIVHNAAGEEASIASIFAGQGMIPPGGTGECAAPKMLEYAFRKGLKPLAMGEFWYGKSPETAVRTHGRFYPSCTSKCGPLLKFMLKGLDSGMDKSVEYTPETLYEDNDIIVLVKPGGMPSVPGLDGKKSALEWLGDGFHAVHRLDMDTSGVMVFAKNERAAIDLRKQFEEHSIKKTYTARLSHVPDDHTGRITLPLSADYDERPRQKVDMVQGKPAITDYQVTTVNENGTADVLFYPVTGRTHQLRVHSAHTLGLGCPIVGDLLYAGAEGSRLCLHALSITFRHPSTNETLTFRSEKMSYQAVSPTL